MQTEKFLNAPKEEQERLGSLITKYETQLSEIRKEALSFEKKRDIMNSDSEKSLRHHHGFALGVVCFQISIVLSSMAVMLKRSLLWYSSIGLGVVGLLAFVDGFLLLWG